MIKKLFILCMSLFVQLVFATEDNRRIVAVAKFKSEVPTQYDRAITEKVIEMLTKSQRFKVVDRTSIRDVIEEMDLQSTEYFQKSTNVTRQEKIVGADFIISGHIRQISISEITNVDGSVSGYRASLSFVLKIIETETTISGEAQSFESKSNNKCLSPERAVDDAIRSLEESMANYFKKNFPINVKMVKILDENDGEAKTILIGGGESMGIEKGNKFLIQEIELIDGAVYPRTIGKAKVQTVSNENFSECKILDGNKEIFKIFNSGKKISCSLIKD